MRKLCAILCILALLANGCALGETIVSDYTEQSAGEEQNLSDSDQLLAFRPDSDTESDSADDSLFSTNIVVSGDYIWRIAESEIICANGDTKQDVAFFAADSLFDPENNRHLTEELFGPDYACLVARNENGVWLCATATDEEDHLRVMLFDLAFSDNRIVISAMTEVTAVLSAFFDESKNWLEIDMIGCGTEQILIAALDQEYIFNLSCWHPLDGILTTLESVSLLFYSAAIPYESNILLIGPSPDASNSLDLNLLDLSTGEQTSLDPVMIDSDPTSADNFVWYPAENLLCFTIGKTMYRVSPEDGKLPVPFAVTDKTPVLNRLGAAVGNWYAGYAADGSLFYGNLQTALSTSRIRITDASGNGNLPDLVSAFNGVQPNYNATVSVCDDENKISEYMLNQSADYDIYVISTDTGLYDSLKSKGYYTDLAGNGTLRTAFADLPETIRALLSDDNRITAVPIGTDSNCLALNVSALQNLTGLSREDIPTDWPGFLNLLGELAENNTLADNPQYTVFESGYTADGLKEEIFARIMSDCLLWQKRSNSSADSISPVLLPVLQKFDTIAWDQFGLPEDEPEDLDWFMPNEQIPLLSVVQPEIAVMDMDRGVEYWPLSMNSTCDRLIPQAVSVMIVNPWSTQAEGALAFMEYAWDNLDILAKMSLCQSLNDPVENTAYDEDIAYLEQMSSVYRNSIANAETDEEAASLQLELDELEEFLNEYRANAVWLASEESIAEYRALSSQMALAVPEFWSADEEDAAVLQFLDGMITADQFVSQYVNTLKMSILESE